MLKIEIEKEIEENMKRTKLKRPPLREGPNKDAYMHEQTTKEFGKMNICITRFGIRIGDRKYLNEYTPFGSVSLCVYSS